MPLRSRRELILIFATILAAYAAIVTEVLSAFIALTAMNVTIAWSVFVVVALAVAFRQRGTISLRWPRLAVLEIVPMLAVGVVLAVTLALAIICPPNNWDVILYHLPRQVQWLQASSVAHFPTQDYRLTVNPPLMEYLGSHLMLMSGSDRMNSVLSWSGLVLTLIAVSLLARDLGVSRLGQWIAAASAATIPMAIHEAASGKNDGLVAFWLVAVMWWLVKLWTAPAIRLRHALFFGSTLGLLALTKGTGTVFAAPIVVLSIVPLRRHWKAMLCAFAIALAFNAPHLLRNYQAYGSPAGKTFGLGNERHDLPAVTSNLLRNIAMNLATPNASWNARIERLVLRQHASLGLQASDAATTWGGQVFQLDYAPQREQAGAPLHLLLIAVAAIASLFRLTKLWCLYWLVLLGGFTAFCIAFKWQPWHPRLQLPLVTLASVAVGWLATRKYCEALSPLLVASLLGAALPSLFESELRPITGSSPLNVLRTDAETIRCLGDSQARDAIRDVVQRVGTKSVDLVNHGALPWEYPLTRALKLAHNPRHVGYFYPVVGSPNVDPAEVVVDISDHPGPRQIRHASGAVYVRVAVIGPFTLYEPGPAIPGEPLDHAVGRFGIGAEPPAFIR